MARPDASLPDAGAAARDDPAGRIRLGGSISRADVDAVCARASPALAAGWSGPVICDLGRLDGAALPAVDVLARLALLARRHRRELRLEHAGPATIELLVLCGLDDLLGGVPCPAGDPPAPRIRPRGDPAGRTAGRSAGCRGRT